jgi:putative hydrolase of the HAD superfamily
MRAIVFDFFGTLTNPENERSRRSVYDATAQVLGVPPDDFWQAVTASFTDRATGAFGGTAEALQEMATRCGRKPTRVELAAAVQVHHAGAQLLHFPRAGSLEVLRTLRDRGFGLGLLSDCSSELCEAWKDTVYAAHFDVTIFSWAVGYRKPDARGFSAVAEGLGVPPSLCWFVGDGGSRELSGAAAVGMTPILVANTAFPEYAQYQFDPDAFVPRHVVDDIVDVPEVVGLPTCR